ncbi:MAG: FKBP-type peptidyl-prolyl cis-trans isomerase [Ferruginibacter sp.]|nr:FKBP-type peptidyl-prolyl cis-trans isomerase [Ferruginibacter sp.]
MKQLFYLPAICMLVLSACTGSFKKGDKGLEYKIVSSGSGKTISYGNFMQIHIKQVYGGTKDTVLMDTHEYMSRVQPFDSVNTPLPFFKILKQLRKGDSVVIRMLTDSVFKDQPAQMPPFMKKGKYLYTHVTMVNIFETQQQADSANQAEATAAKPRIYKKQIEEIEKGLAEKKVQLDAEIKVIEAYLAKNNIKATKTKWGTYVAVTTEGTGEKLSAKDIAVVNYTGRTLDSGKVFDSNIDPKFQHVQPMEVALGELGGSILGWNDAILQLKKGSKATVYIPATLGYGETGNAPKIKPGENLVFDIEVTDVMTEEAYVAKQKAMQKMQEEMMKKMQESQNQAPAPADTKKTDK